MMIFVLLLCVPVVLALIHEIKERVENKKMQSIDNQCQEEHVCGNDNNILNNQKLPKTMIWAFVLVGAQILYNAGLMIEAGSDTLDAVGYSIGAHILTIVAVILFYKAYKDK